MKQKSTEQLERQIRLLKRENLLLKDKVKKLEKDNDRLQIAKEIAESQARYGDGYKGDL